tara:strand:- start:311 stop:592 length:282 start_codon:yes stop_codon:yes gene_type:complete
MARTKSVDGLTVPFTQAEEEAQDAIDSAWAAGADDRSWAELRSRRDELLSETDWQASSDVTMTAEQSAYRQQLRDLPANTEDPDNVTWPTKPS